VSDKTEAPTPRKLHDAREEGQVVRSIELNTAVIMLVSMMLLRGPGGDLVRTFQQEMVALLVELPKVSLTEPWLRQQVYIAVMRVLPSLGLILAGLLLAGASATVVQTGFLWSSKRIGFDWKRVNPLSGFKRVFSAQSLVELLKALLKLALVTFTAYSYLRGSVDSLLGLHQTDFASAMSLFTDFAFGLGLRVGAAYLVIAVADYAYQRWSFMRQMKMTKQEIKDEYKRAEGDPFLKSRIRSQMRRMARGRMMANVPKATVIVTNPTHLALAMEYREGMAAPRLLAKGAHHVAARIVAIARENNIPVVQNIPLAHAIYKTVEVDQEISPDLYMAMAEVLAYVYRLRARSAARPAASTVRL
jgi:flagellar biosynthetic protein FlhB